MSSRSNAGGMQANCNTENHVHVASTPPVISTVLLLTTTLNSLELIVHTSGWTLKHIFSSFKTIGNRKYPCLYHEMTSGRQICLNPRSNS